MVKGGPLSDEEFGLLRRAWPDRPRDDEAALLRSLPLARRQKALARLKALLEIEDARRDNPRGHADMKRIAADAGLTSDGLFAIRQKWAAARELSAIVPYLGRAERQPTQRSDDDPVVLAARRLIAERPEDSDSVLASALRQEFDLSAPVLVRLVRRLRRDDATDPQRIGAVFGRALLLDVCAIDRVTLGDDPRMILVALVVERASGWILGHQVVAAGDDSLAAQAKAVDMARTLIERERIDAPDGSAAAYVTLGDGPLLHAAAEAALHLKRQGVDFAVNSFGPRRYGSRLVALLGKRLGRLWWRPRASAPDDEPPAGAGSAMDLRDAGILVGSEVAAHNAEVIARLAEGGIKPGWGSAKGAMAGTLETVGAMLEGRIIPVVR